MKLRYLMVFEAAQLARCDEQTIFDAATQGMLATVVVEDLDGELISMIPAKSFNKWRAMRKAAGL